jgi:hypothetical protein
VLDLGDGPKQVFTPGAVLTDYGGSMLSVGQRVVCIDDRIPHTHKFHKGEVQPTRGTIYTIREIVPPTVRYPEEGLYLAEIVNPPRKLRSGRYVELIFRPYRFRPVRSTSIDVFLQMVEPTRVLEVAE